VARYESYLSHSDPVVLALNPFFVLEYVSRGFHLPCKTLLKSTTGRNDPTPDRGSQLPRATALIILSLGFIHDLRQGLLDPDAVRGRAMARNHMMQLLETAHQRVCGTCSGHLNWCLENMPSRVRT
jgi:carnitine O-acetyltransferase